MPKKTSHDKIKENFENFFKKIEERMKSIISFKMNITFLQKVLFAKI